MHLIRRYTEEKWLIEAERSRKKNEKREAKFKSKPFVKKTILRKKDSMNVSTQDRDKCPSKVP